MPKPRPSLSERAAATPRPTGGRSCGLGLAVSQLDEPLRSEVIDLVLDCNFTAPVVTSVLADPDIGLHIGIDSITKHRRGDCRHCQKTGRFPQP